MSDFRVTQHPELSPTKCRFCATVEGPMIDTYVDDPIYGGRVYICGPIEGVRPGCVGNIAHAFGYRSQADYAALEQKIEQLLEKVKTLQEKKTVTLSVRDFLNSYTTGNGNYDYTLLIS